jgi:hypothetical protein
LNSLVRNHETNLLSLIKPSLASDTQLQLSMESGMRQQHLHGSCIRGECHSPAGGRTRIPTQVDRVPLPSLFKQSPCAEMNLNLNKKRDDIPIKTSILVGVVANWKDAGRPAGAKKPRYSCVLPMHACWLPIVRCGRGVVPPCSTPKLTPPLLRIFHWSSCLQPRVGRLNVH